MATFEWDVLQKKAEEGGKEGRVAPGQYRAQITDAVTDTTNSGKPQVILTWKVIEGPQSGATVIDRIILSQENNKAMFMFFRRWENLGVPKAKFTGSFSLEQAAAMVKGKTGTIVVEHNPNPNDPTSPYCNVKSAQITDTKSNAVEV